MNITMNLHMGMITDQITMRDNFIVTMQMEHIAAALVWDAGHDEDQPP